VQPTPKVSVLLVTYNRAERLPATLDSLLAQSFRDFELIVSDDCSTDATPSICAAYAGRDARVRYRCNPRNLRMPGNLNAAIAEARGELLAITHDGDVYRPDLLEKWTAALERHPSAGFVFNAYRMEGAAVGGTTRIDVLDMPECMNGHEFLRRVFIPAIWGCPVHGTTMVRRASLEAVGGAFDPAYSMHSDVEMWARLAGRYDVAYLSEPLISIMRRESGHFLERHYWWEKTVNVRVKRIAFQIVSDGSWRSRLGFELRARAIYLLNTLLLLKNRRWGEAAAGLRLVATGREDMPPPR
jgi:glycosyltransferase involved in cell wall biosynthesis